MIVAAASANGLDTAVRAVLPTGASLPELLAIAALSAVFANLVNNLPATLILIPVAATAAGPGPVLATLIGVNVGPNLTYVGSLATLLWRRILDRHGAGTTPVEFLRLGVRRSRLDPDTDDLVASDIDVYAPCALGDAVNDVTVHVLKARVICGEKPRRSSRA